MTDKQPQQEEVMAGHEYDGIQELDNPLPRWWLYGFYLTIVFGVFYVIYYQFGPGTSLVDAYNERVASLQAARAEKAKGGVDANALLAAVANHEEAEKGKTLFAERCAACHGDAGQGVIGPNLTDAYWIHGGKPDQILHTVRTGVADKGMPAWGESMSDPELVQVVSYIVSIKGTNPPNAKEPQGTPEEGAAAPQPVGETHEGEDHGEHHGEHHGEQGQAE